MAPLDEIEVKLQLLEKTVGLQGKTSSEICNILLANFGLQCDERDIHLLMAPDIITNIDEAAFQYRDFL